MGMLAELSLREILVSGLGCLTALAWLNTGVAQAGMIPTASMAPAFAPGDRILVRPLDPARRAISRGDIVIFKPTGVDERLSLAPEVGGFRLEADQAVMKRAIGLPGERVQIERGIGVWIDGRHLHEPYATEAPDYDWGPAVVPQGHLFVLGDNRNHSSDSHVWGFLPLRQVTGRPGAVLWPPARWRRL